jgi:hypothetical protein
MSIQQAASPGGSPKGAAHGRTGLHSRKDRVLGQARRVLEVGIGVEYWYNVYGKPAGVVPGAKQPPIFALTVHLPTGHSAE